MAPTGLYGGFLKFFRGPDSGPREVPNGPPYRVMRGPSRAVRGTLLLSIINAIRSDGEGFNHFRLK